jgi:excinuclease UvrABC ATPase subunit
VITLDLAFMDDVEQPCDACNGTGYKPEVLPYLYRGKNIVEVLNMTVEDSIGFFKEKEIVDLLNKISEMGLHYMTLGQSLNTFSGGERQRLKLALELDETGQLFVFDEPTTGLHPSDIKKLLTVFHRLADNGNTVIIIEHNLDVVSQADWIIDMGPGAGHEGGQIVFEGLLKDLLLSKTSKTGKYLASYLQARP